MDNIKSKIIRPIGILGVFSLCLLWISWLFINPLIESENHGSLLLIYLIQTAVLLIVISIFFYISKSEATKIHSSLTKIKEATGSIKNVKTHSQKSYNNFQRSSDPEYFPEISSDLREIDNQFKLLSSSIVTALSEIEEQGSATKDFSGSLNMLEANRSLTSINNKIKLVFDSLKTVELKRKSYTNSQWDDANQKIQLLIAQNTALEKQMTDIESFAKKIEAGDFSVRFRSNINKETETAINSFVLTIENNLKEIERALASGFSQKINIGYQGQGQLNSLKNSYNKAVDTNIANIESLKTKISDLQQANIQFKPTKTIRRAANPDAFLKPMAPIPKFKDIDFTGRGFGKY